MEKNELLCVQRQQPGRITWEPIGGMPAALRRSTAAFGSGKRPFMLSRADTVSATILPLEPGTVHVALTARHRGRREPSIVGGGAALAGARRGRHRRSWSRSARCCRVALAAAAGGARRRLR